MKPDFGSYVPIAGPMTEAGWDRVKADRLDADPCPNAADAAAVNVWVNNEVNYQLDPNAWQTPAQTLATLSGDCKDYAVLKRAILLSKGVPEETLFLVVGIDMQSGGQHAVIWTSDGVMDNFKGALLSPDDLQAVFEPVFALSEKQSFFYEMLQPAPSAADGG
jgi:predicted transglutaminase-like cysteine proteinase